MTVFQYDRALLERFPAICGGVILARGMQSGPAPSMLAEAFRVEQAAVLGRLGGLPLSEVPSLAAWRRAFSAFGVPPTKYRSAAEALLRRLTKKGDIPGINLLVDLGNLVSIRYGLPLAVFDLQDVAGALTVRFAGGHERFTELGSDEILHPEPGEVVFVDEADVVFARRWCWRQSAQSAATEHTTDALITVEAHHDGASRDVASAVSDLLALLNEYAGGTHQSAVLSAEKPRFDV